MNSKKVAIIAFTDKGKALSKKLTEKIDYKIDIFDGNNIKDYLSSAFYNNDIIIFISAVGIATRLISSLVKSKETDPAVIVIDELCTFAIPILSGHIGGANEFALEMSEKTGAIAVITTATDLNNKFAVDVWAYKNNCKIYDITKIKHISSAILKSENVGFYSDYANCGDLPHELNENAKEIGICVSINENAKPFKTTLNIIPKTITLGVGCRKNTSVYEFEKFILEILKQNEISILAIEKIASIDLKINEECILSFSKKYNIPFVTYTASELNSVQGEFNKSEFVKKVTGVDNVCERSAVICSNSGKVILPKTSNSGITVCLAEKEWKCKF